MNEIIPYGKQTISNDDIETVIKVLKSDWLTQGPMVPKFEKTIALKCSANYAVAVNSATSALHISCLALGVQSGDTVWTCTNTFVASANAALYCGAKIDFIDIDQNSWCMSVSKLNEKLERHKRLGLKLPKVLIPVHLAGQSCDMLEIFKLSKKYGFKIIEDASHALGGKYKNFPVGCCKYSDITVFSFHPVKIITTGEGGIALTNKKGLKKKLELYRSHGIIKDAKKFKIKNPPLWHYEQQCLGFNYRMTDIQAALGISQINKLEEFVNLRNLYSKIYIEKLCDKVSFQEKKKDVYSSRHLFIIRVNEKIHLKLFNYLRKLNILVNLHYMPVHLQPFYKNQGFKLGDFPNSESYSKQAISLPIYPLISSKKINHVIELINKFFS